MPPSMLPSMVSVLHQVVGAAGGDFVVGKIGGKCRTGQSPCQNKAGNGRN